LGLEIKTGTIAQVSKGYFAMKINFLSGTRVFLFKKSNYLAFSKLENNSV
jgi:hypothetical protein